MKAKMGFYKLAIGFAIPVLLLTAALKLFALIEGNDVLDKADPILRMPYGVAFFVIGVVELAMVGVLVLGRTIWKACGLILFGGAVITYKGLAYVSPNIEYCACLGRLHILEGQMVWLNLLLTGFGVILFAGGIIGVLCLELEAADGGAKGISQTR